MMTLTFVIYIGVVYLLYGFVLQLGCANKNIRLAENKGSICVTVISN